MYVSMNPGVYTYLPVQCIASSPASLCTTPGNEANICAKYPKSLTDVTADITCMCVLQTLAAYSHHTATTVANSASSSYPFLQQGRSLNRELLNSLVTKVNKDTYCTYTGVPDTLAKLAICYCTIHFGYWFLG